MLECCALCILVARLGYILRGAGAKGGTALTLAGGLLVLAFTLPKYREPISAVLEMAAYANLTEEVSLVFRILFVGILCGVAADICRDMGEGSVADRLELCARAEMLLLALPFLLEIFRFAFEVIA